MAGGGTRGCKEHPYLGLRDAEVEPEVMLQKSPFLNKLLQPMLPVPSH